MSNTTAPTVEAAASCSAIMSMPPDVRSAVMKAIRKPRFLARVLREEAESAEEWANAHSDGKSLTHRKGADGNWITKRESYAAKAIMLRAAADVFDPPNIDSANSSSHIP